MSEPLEPTPDLPADEALLALARALRDPPPVPRDALWARIEAARRGGGPAPLPVGVLPLRRRPTWLAWPLAAAALVLLGIGLGRWTAQSGAPEGQIAAVPAERADTTVNAAYRLALQQHLGQAEALLTLVRASARQGQSGTQSAVVARELLATNRLLTDSPAARDPRLRLLLDDLELVLVQIAQLPAGSTREDLDLVTDGIDRGVLVRLRTAVPAGAEPLLFPGAL